MDRQPDLLALRAAAHELTGAYEDFDALIDRIGDAGCVLIGESTHGTAEFYAARAHITERLIEERGFRAVAVEADWPDAHRAGDWARGRGDDPDAAAALGDFTRFPRWTWRNRQMLRFLGWQREHNAATGDDVGFYGLDLRATQVVELQRRVGPEAWNLRERHMAETLDALRRDLAGDDEAPAKVVVWAHNSHVGDARATEVAQLGQLTLGQLVREAYGADAVLVGLTTYAGAVTAAAEWGGPATTMPVAPGREDSLEALLHESGPANLMLVMGESPAATAALAPTRLQRAIGVVYRPQTEGFSHYVFADVTRQFDALIHLDVTSPLEPLDGPALAAPEARPQDLAPARRV